MNKYVIELRPDCKVVQEICESYGQVSIGAKSINYLEELTSDYINEHYGDLQDTAYQRGINDGSLDVKQRVEGAYQRGLDEAWECARKVALNPNENGLSVEELDEIFGCATIQQVFRRYTVSEVIAKLKAYEEKAENDIRVGDEVIDEDGEKFWVTKIHNGIAEGIMANGEVTCTYLNVTEQTGRHVDINKILEEMRHD